MKYDWIRIILDSMLGFVLHIPFSIMLCYCLPLISDFSFHLTSSFVNLKNVFHSAIVFIWLLFCLTFWEKHDLGLWKKSHFISLIRRAFIHNKFLMRKFSEIFTTMWIMMTNFWKIHWTKYFYLVGMITADVSITLPIHRINICVKI